MKICLYQPDITAKECRAAFEVLKTPYLALGPKLKEFEEKFAKYIGTKYAIPLILAIAVPFDYLQFRYSQGDEVIISLLALLP